MSLVHVTKGPVRYKKRDLEEAPPTRTGEGVPKAITHYTEWAAGAGVSHTAWLSTSLRREQKYGGRA
jgi:hypothetical protein